MISSYEKEIHVSSGEKSLTTYESRTQGHIYKSGTLLTSFLSDSHRMHNIKGSYYNIDEESNSSPSLKGIIHSSFYF